MPRSVFVGPERGKTILGLTKAKKGEPMKGNHRVDRVGPIQIGCMDLDARNLMDRALKEYDEHVEGIKKYKPDHEGSVYSFAYWLFRWSGLVGPKGEFHGSEER